MIHNHERLLVKLVEQHHGLVPSLTAKLLLHHGSILMKRALALSPLKSVDFRRGLDALVHCNLARVSALSKRHSVVEIQTERIVALLYYPYYLEVVKRRFDITSVYLLRTLMLYGNLSLEDLIERTLYFIVQSNELLKREMVEEQMKMFIETLFDNFKKIVKQKIFVPKDRKMRCPEQCDADAIFAMLKRRFERHPDGLPSDPTARCEEGQWTFDCNVLNFLFFIEFFPIISQPCFDNEEASFLVNLLLEMTFEKSYHMKKTSLTISEVYARYRTKYPAVNISKLANILRNFSYFLAPNFYQIEKSEVSLNFNLFLRDIVLVHIKEYVHKNFGEYAVRIFGALLQEPCVFENNLLMSLRMDSKELHRNMYQLDLHRMINITYYHDPTQSSAISSRNMKKAFAVDLKEAVTYVRNRCYYALYTHMHRRHITMDDQKELIARKQYIEDYKAQIIAETTDDPLQQEAFIKSAHEHMSEYDHRKAEAMLKYSEKVDKVLYHTVNAVFLMNMWAAVDTANDYDDMDF